MQEVPLNLKKKRLEEGRKKKKNRGKAKQKKNATSGSVNFASTCHIAGVEKVLKSSAVHRQSVWGTPSPLQPYLVSLAQTQEVKGPCSQWQR